MSNSKFGFAQQKGVLFGVRADEITGDVVESLYICDISDENIDELIAVLQEVKKTFAKPAPRGVVLH